MIDNADQLDEVLEAIATFPGPKILVHGGGSLASRMEESMGLEPKMVQGRRVTSKASLEVVTMVYAGRINKEIVALLQKHGANGIGLAGPDGNIIRTRRRAAEPIDFGFVGDVEHVNASMLNAFLDLGLLPVISAITHDGRGQLLNTNADTMAAEVAMAMSKHYDVDLVMTFEKAGVLNEKGEVIPAINHAKYETLKEEKVILDGMIPKLDNAFRALSEGVETVKLVSPQYLLDPNIEYTNVVRS